MHRLIVLALLLVANSPPLTPQAFADMKQAVWYPSAQVEAEADECSFGPCSINRYGEVRLQKVNMFDPEFVHVKKSDRGYSSIGAIKNHESGQRGTAFLLANCYILTNRHLVIDDDGKVNSDSSFYIGVSLKNEFKKEINATIVEYGKDNSTGEDFAVLELDRCVGETYGYAKILNWDLDMILQVPKHNVAIKMAGYPGTESKEELSLDEDCIVPSFHPLDETALAENCNSARGSSGSPIFIWKVDTQQIYAFAMHSGATPAPDVFGLDAQFYGTAMAKDPQYFNLAVPMYAIYERIKKYLPEDADAK